MRLYFSPDYVAAGHAFDTTRKAQWIVDSLREAPIPGVDLVAPAPLTRDQGEAVHDPAYVRAIETGEPRHLSESQGFRWDGALWRAVLASNGGVVAAARAAMEDGVAGSLSSGLHHARHDTGHGFCTFNGLAIAAKAALAAGARTVLIVDLDAHCGGGTASLIAGDTRIRQIDVSVSPVDSYESTDQCRLAMVRDAAEYLPTVRRMLASVDGEGFELCLYNAGMDPHEKCAIGGLAGITRDMLAEREQTVFAWCAKRRLPVAFVLAGGYTGPRLHRAELVALHRCTLSAAIHMSLLYGQA